MKKRLIIFLAIVLAFSMVFSVSCKKHATKDDYSQVAPVPDDANLDPESGINLLPEGNGIIFDEDGIFRIEDSDIQLQYDSQYGLVVKREEET